MSSRLSSLSGRRAVLFVLALCAAAVLAVDAPRAQRPSTLAITGASIVPRPGADATIGTIVITNGTIAAVGLGAAVPPGAEVINADGRGFGRGFRWGDRFGGFGSYDEFVVAEPHVSLLTRVTDWFGVNVGVGYRATGDDFDLGDSLSGASFSLGFRFGPSVGGAREPCYGLNPALLAVIPQPLRDHRRTLPPHGSAPRPARNRTNASIRLYCVDIDNS